MCLPGIDIYWLYIYAYYVYFNFKRPERSKNN